MAGGARALHLELFLEAGVCWDINTCPVPPGFDPRRVSGCIESALEKKIGRRPDAVSIYAIGNLEYIPSDLLEVISSSGITLIHGIRNTMDFNRFLDQWSENSINIETTYTMVITDDYGIADPPLLGRYEFPKLCAYPKDGRLIALANQSNPENSVLACDFVWETLLSDNYADDTVEMMNSTGRKALYVCYICHTYFEGEEFSSTHLKFSTHLKGEEHRTKLFAKAPIDSSNGELKHFCKVCNYPADNDYNLILHNQSEEHNELVGKKAQEEYDCESRKRGPEWDPVAEINNKKQSLERGKQ